MNDNDDGTVSSSTSVASSSVSVYEPEYEWEEIPIPGVVALQNDDDNDDNDEHDDDDDFSLHVLTVVPPPLEYMSRLHSQQQEISGRQVWTGSLFLAQVLFLDATERQLLLSCQQKRILELGSGTGVLGMALYKFLSLRHSKNDYNQHQHHYPIVALTDGDIKAVELLQQNLNHADNRNAMHLHDHTSVGDDDDDDDDNDDDIKKYECCCKATCLQWGVPESLNQFDDWCRESFVASTTFSSVLGTTTGSQADDEEEETKTVSSLPPPPPPFVFDVIVAGDVLYKPDLPRIFFDTVRQLLVRRQQQEQQDQHTDRINNNQQSSNCSGSGGILWLCHVPRSTVTHELVLQAANQAGFTVEQTISLNRLKQTRSNKSVETFGIDGCPLEDVERARVYRMVLQTEAGQVTK